jgi:1-aminocyclopropane-1-carboxylate deaminase/D-cysteine desulfhydrase-like pyridoxal-dependent ACC family enzyme
VIQRVDLSRFPRRFYPPCRLALTEGVLLDPVCPGKAMAGLIGLIWRKTFRHGQRVLLIHTWGAPALYAYREDLS